MKNVGLAAALACAALAGGCAAGRAHGKVAYGAKPRMAPPGRAAVVAPVARGGGPARATAPWQREPGPAEAAFMAEQRARADREAERVRERVAAGRLDPVAAEQAARERAYVDGLLSQYGADGTLTPDERNHISTSVGQMGEIGARPPRAVGGGPRSHHRAPGTPR